MLKSDERERRQAAGPTAGAVHFGLAGLGRVTVDQIEFSNHGSRLAGRAIGVFLAEEGFY